MLQPSGKYFKRFSPVLHTICTPAFRKMLYEIFSDISYDLHARLQEKEYINL